MDMAPMPPITPPPQMPALSDLAPFVSVTLLTIRGGTSAGVVGKILTTASGACGPEQDTVAPQRTGGATSGALIYIERKPPSWWPSGPAEIRYQYLVVLLKGAHVALCASDAAFRDKIAERVVDAGIADHVTPKTMTHAFVGPEAKTAWLNGIHTPSAVKADAKMLSGHALEFAIDPLGDHTYCLTALRSRPEIDGLQKPEAKKRKARTRTVGAAPGRARIWLSRSDNWADFNGQVIALLDHLAAGSSQAPRSFSSLANALDGIDDLGQPYAIALLPPAFVDEDAVRTSEQIEVDMRLAYDAHMKIVSGEKGEFKAEVSVNGEAVGELEVTLKRKADRFDVKCAWTDPTKSQLRTAVAAAFQRRDGLKIYYDDGRTFADGRVYSTRFVEAEFDWMPLSFAGFDVHREKPDTKGGKLIDAIRAEADFSLFDFVRVHWGAKGMLACDDGSMELADFVHFDPETARIELIHVKAAGGDPVKAAASRAKAAAVKSGARRRLAAAAVRTSADRRISVSDYEVVAAQAIKNIRNLDKNILVQRLKSSAGNEMATATWIDGSLVPSREKLIATLEKMPSTLKRKVTILQPRLTMNEIAACREDGPATKRGVQFNQLNALMLATRQAVSNLGAEFSVYADSVGWSHRRSSSGGPRRQMSALYMRRPKLVRQQPARFGRPNSNSRWLAAAPITNWA